MVENPIKDKYKIERTLYKIVVTTPFDDEIELKYDPTTSNYRQICITMFCKYGDSENKYIQYTDCNGVGSEIITETDKVPKVLQDGTVKLGVPYLYIIDEQQVTVDTSTGPRDGITYNDIFIALGEKAYGDSE